MTDAMLWLDTRMVAAWHTLVSCHGQHWWPCMAIWAMIATVSVSVVGALAFGDPTWPVRMLVWLGGR